MREVNIGGVAYKVEYGFNAICALEDTLDKSVAEIGTAISQGKAGAKLQRAVFWAGLLGYRRNITLEQAGSLIDDAGSDLQTVLGEVYMEFFESLIARIKSETPDDKKK